MKTRALFFLLPGGVAAGLAAALVDAGVKSGILLLIACVAAVALRKSAAATRHVVWTAAVACALAMPVLSLCLPQWRVLPSWMRSEPAAREGGSLTAVLPPLPTDSQVQVQQTSGAEGETLTIRNDLPATASETQSPALASISMEPIRSNFSGSTVVLLGWALGAGLLLLPLLRSAWSLHRLSHRSEIIANGVLAEALEEVTHELQLRRSVTLHAGSADAMPMVWGVWSAHLLLPSSAEHWLPARLRAVMLHELAHIRRRDPLTLMLAQLARAIHWFNPFAWVAVHRLRAEQEKACDDYVLRAGVKPSDYASDVLEIATALRAAPATASMALSMARPARLEHRLRVIVDAASNRTALTGWIVAAAVIVSIAIALPLAMVRAADEKPEANTSKPSAFGPVVERTIYDVNGNHPDDSFIDLDSGELFSESRLGPLPQREEDLAKQMAKAKIEIMGDASGQTFAAFGMVMLPTDEKFDRVTVERVDKLLVGHSPSDKPQEVKIPKDLPATYLFKTRESGCGVLEVMRYNNDYESMSVRYKLVQQPETAGHAQAAVEPTSGVSIAVTRKSSVFGPVVERTVSDITSGNSAESFLDLDTGELFAESGIQRIAGQEDWWEPVDFMGEASKQAFAVYSMVLLPAEGRFDSVPVERIDERLTRRGAKSELVQIGEKLPATYLFKTREGGRGVLEIVRYNGPRSMDIRYKLVQQPEAAVHQPSSRYVFDREYEREMRSDASYLDLDTGKFVEAHPPGDLVFSMAESDLRARAGLDMIAVAVGAESWNASPDEIMRELSNSAPQKQVRIGGSASQIVTSEPKPQQTWFFKTREGGAGVLQSAPHTERAGSVNIHYKLVRARREFAPVTLILLQSGAESKQFLNLTDGRSYRAKPAGVPVVYLEHDPQNGWNLIVEGIYNYPTEPEKGAKLWESMSAEEIAQPAGLAAVPFEQKGVYQLRAQDRPSVILIPQWGLLRIDGLDDRTTTARIQYKRVAAEGLRDVGSPAESEKPRTSLAPSAGAQQRLQQAEAELERTTKLHAAKQISDEKLYDAKFDAEIARAELKGDHEEAARIRLRKAEAGFERLTKLHAAKLVSSEALKKARLNVELQRAALKGDDLGFAQIQEQLRRYADHTSGGHNDAASSGQRTGAGEIAKDVLQAESDPNSWGKAVRGVQTRFQASKAIWKQTETPKLRLEIRNVSAASLPIPVTQELGELEVDGKSYRWPAKVRVWIPRLEARESRYVSVTLSSDWRNEAGEALALSPGNHSVRFALGNAWSNQVTIEIARETPPSLPSPKEEKVSATPAPVSAARAVVDEWLSHIGAERTEQMWALTTREQGGLSLDVSKAWAFKSIRAKYVLGNDSAAMVVSTPYKDNAGRARVLLCTLVKRDGRWLIHEHLYGNPEDIQLRVAGFAAYPGVKYDVRAEDVVGKWKTVFFGGGATSHNFKRDGSGETQELKGERRGGTTPFRWEVQGNVFRRHYRDKTYDGTIIRLDEDHFVVRYGDGQVGYERVTEAAPPPGANTTPAGAPGFIGLAFGPGDFREITSVVESSPAAAAGLERGDYVTEIDGKPTTEIKDLKEFKDLLRGAAGSEVKLSVRKARANKTVTLELQRAELPPPMPSKPPSN